MKRIAIIGTTGCGKTTLAAEISRLLGLVHIELDALNWLPGWTMVPDEVFRQKVSDAVKGPQWVIDGNYRSVRDLIWERADCLVWLDYRFSLVMRRLLGRTIRRSISGEPCCNGNQETLRKAFSRDSIILWALQTHGRRRREYPLLLRGRSEQGKAIVVHRSPKETRAWLDNLRAGGGVSRS
jgi:adenylate kinase family enzyme